MGRVLVLLYHRVRNYIDDPQLLSVNIDNFSKQMEWLSQNYYAVSFDDDWDNIEGDAVCITFDDGYRDNFLYAAPILEKYNVPATIFVSTGNIDSSRELWWDELERNLLVLKDYPDKFWLDDDVFNYKFNTSNKEQRMETYKSLHWLLKEFVSVEKREHWLRELQEWNGYTENGRYENRLCTVEELQNINHNIIQIGAHTISHPRLSILDYNKQYEEISGAKKYLENVLKKEVTTFSYPFGSLLDYNQDTIKICKVLALKKVASNYPGVWEKGTDKYQIPRNIVRDWQLDVFREKVKSFWGE